MSRTQREIADLEWRALRDQAQTITCPHCAADPGQVCHTADGYPLNKFPAHSIRIARTQEPQ